MSVKNKSQLTTDVNTFLPDNSTEEISAKDERDRFIDVIDSSLNTTDGGLVVVAETGYTTEVALSSSRAFAHVKYVDDEVAAAIAAIPVISDTAYDATTWNSNTDGATKNAIRDKFVTVDAAIAAAIVASYYPDLTGDTDVDVVSNRFRFMNSTDELFSVEDTGNVTIGNILYVNSISGGDPTIDLAKASPGNYVIKRVGTAVTFSSVGLYKVLHVSGVRFDTPAEDDVQLTYGGGIWTFYKETKFLDNMAIGFSVNYGGGARVFYLTNADAAPTTDPTTGVIIYAEGGSMKRRDTGGNVVTL
jgi:hypothetical protein